MESGKKMTIFVGGMMEIGGKKEIKTSLEAKTVRNHRFLIFEIIEIELSRQSRAFRRRTKEQASR